ncbi:MAG: carbohydrate kinase [Lachnospiraceae bacterium]|nr:carbohydrate kinase [Lachnospiraceae bacterium]
MKIAGLDIGTTGCKCTVFDENGLMLGKAYRDYPIKRGVSGHEVDVSAIMDGVYVCLAEVAKEYPDIAGIGVTSFGETFVMTDMSGEPLYPAMLYTDPRGKAECQKLVAALGEKNIANITGLRPHEMYSIPKIMWIKEYEASVYEKASYIFLMEDYVVYHLTGRRQIDYSLATRTMAFDIRNLGWSKTVFDAAGIDISKMSAPVQTGTDAGKITDATAARTGLSRETHIISVSHDQVAAAVGAGAFDSSVAVDGAGTVECITPIFDGIPDIDIMYRGYFSIVPYVIPGKYVAYAFSYTGGALMQWCAETLAKSEQQLAEAEGISVNEYLEREYHYIAASEKTSVQSPSGLLVLPHFAGAATPYMDTGSKGVILGLTTDTSVAEIYRGCMEGVVYEMCLNVKALEGSGTCFNKLHATGGGAHSKEWMQMKADMLGLPITALRTVDAGTVGCAMLTGIAIGVFSDLEDAASHMVEETDTYEPRWEIHEKYMEIYKRYEKLYEAVRPLV